MPTVFLSHASRDDGIARQLEAWLVKRGFDDFFADHSDIRSGDRWTEALRRAKGACRVVLCLVTPNWLASDECFGEFTAAWYQGKRIIPLFAANALNLDNIQKRRLTRVRGEDQGFDLTAAIIDGGLNIDRLTAISEPLEAGLRAGGALAKVGLDPRAFEIDRTLQGSPYPGLQSFDDDDANAAIFFGRSPEISRCLEDLREMRANGVRQPYAILGASGSGKSSLMKAGVLPRLRRERGWIALRAFRPGSDPLFNFAAALARTLNYLGIASAAGPIRDALISAWHAAPKIDGLVLPEALPTIGMTLESYFARIRDRADRHGATMLIFLDQAEELIRQDGESADALCDYLRAALATRSAADPEDASVRALLAFTVRSDSLTELQRAHRFIGLDARCADIRPVPVYRFAEVIEGPAERCGIQIDPGLVEIMIEDVPGEDALPLLAFALQRLWKQYEPEARLQRSSYDSVGKLAGLIEDAAERALRGFRPDEDSPLPPHVSIETERLASKTFVPPLAQVSEGGATIRRVAAVERFNAKALELLEHFVSWRLLVRKRSMDGASNTIEIAHEAIFRAWPRLQRWIEPEKGRLHSLLDLESSARLWDRHGRTPSYIDHRSSRLRQAKALLEHEDFGREIDEVERSYLTAATKAEVQRRTVSISLALGALFLGFVALAVVDIVSMREAMQETATLHVRDGNPLAGGVYAVAGASGGHDLGRFIKTPNADHVLWETAIPLKVLVDIRNQWAMSNYKFSPDGKRLIIASEDQAGSIWEVDTGVKLAELGGDGAVAGLYLSEDGSRLLVRSAENSLALWDVTRATKIAESGSATFKAAALSAKTLRFATLSESGTCTLWDLLSGNQVGIVGTPNETLAFGLSAVIPRIVIRSRDDAADLWDTKSGHKIADLGGAGACTTCGFAPKGYMLLALDRAGNVGVFDGVSGRRIARIKDTARISGYALSADGGRLITRSIYNQLVLWDTRTGGRIDIVGVSDSENYKFSPSGGSFLVRSTNASAELRDSRTGTVLLTLPPAQVKEYSFSDEGDRLTTTGLDKSATLWNAATGVKLAVLAGPGVVDSIRFSQNGRRLSVGSRSSEGSLWDAEHGRKLTDYKRISEDIDGAFSKDGTRYASSSSDSFGSLWNAATGQYLADIGGSGADYDVTLSSDGKRLAMETTGQAGAVFDVSDTPINLTGPSLRERVCKINRRVVGVFPQDVRAGTSKGDGKLSYYLRGRPWHPCDWYGLTSTEGWVQALRYWTVKIGIPWDYRCGERTIGKMDPQEATLCRSPDETKSNPKPKAVKK